VAGISVLRMIDVTAHGARERVNQDVLIHHSIQLRQVFHNLSLRYYSGYANF
jgi:hypothetical protein